MIGREFGDDEGTMISTDRASSNCKSQGANPLVVASSGQAARSHTEAERFLGGKVSTSPPASQVRFEYVAGSGVLALNAAEATGQAAKPSRARSAPF